MDQIIKHIDQNMQDIYRKAVDADEKLTALKKQGMAKFTSIFEQQNLFKCQQNQFMPYVVELADDICTFKENPQDRELLVLITKKLEQLHKILLAFKQVV